MPRGRPKGYPKSGGRKKGTPNKFTGELRDMILQALADAGGVDYLKTQATKSPSAFLALVGRTLPLKVGGDGQTSGTVVFAWQAQPNSSNAGS